MKPSSHCITLLLIIILFRGLFNIQLVTHYIICSVMEGHLVSVLVLLVLVSPGEARVGSASHNVTKQNLKDIDEFVEGVLECWGHPGMSIAVVKDGEVSRK